MKRKKETKGLGRLLFMEWIIPVWDYFQSLRKNEVTFEIILPIFIAGFSSLLYAFADKVIIALDALADILPAAISILIGFTVMLITLLLSSDTDAISMLRDRETDIEVRGEKIKLYQKLHIQLTESLFAEVMLLLTIFGYLFLKAFSVATIIDIVALFLEVYLTMHILLSIVRSTTHLYCAFYKK